MLLKDGVVAAALLRFEKVEVPPLPLEEEEEAVETQALQSIVDVLDHERTATSAIVECSFLPMIPLPIPCLRFQL